ncbi:site-specific tyrosine recombinase XerC [Botrimarina colliarenosi]|uniref:Site-specific tyrosine recombinase XerC n=1 Tax=Botrimarina colliarenosi TaxID=2528001 RepID=A0A5C5ZZ76_9BACT|nr:tyrosine-type recombinase/integrase [Botrimarina colliarenosi]TWT92456.1 site-specific tyrosine recombinase XerC [Botrimarina colliarenosi]
MAKSTNAAAAQKPKKPYPSFPLFPHATKRWAKKIRGKLVYFGPWDDWEGALARYEEQAGALHAGRTPRVSTGVTTVADVVNAFLSAKKSRVESGEVSQRFWDELHDVAERLVDHLGRDRAVDDLAPADFVDLRRKFAQGVGLIGLSKRIQGVRSAFKYAYESDLIDRPVKFGPDFKKPSAKSLRSEKQSKPAKVFSADEVRSLLAAATEPLRTMILLGINGGFGNHDVGKLPWSSFDTDAGWIDFPRPKTAVPRRIPLWPETITALEAWKDNCRLTKDGSGALVFVTRWGQPYAKEAGSYDSTLSKEFAKLTKKLGITRKGRGFYGLRHTFETVAGDTADQVAVNAIMGHVDMSMAANYRHGVSDDRLRAVVDAVRGWVFCVGDGVTHAPGRD